MDDRGFLPSDDGSGPGQMSESDRVAVVNALASEMTELFHGYTSGDVSFEELSFEMYDTLQTLYAIASGDVSIEFEYEDDDALDDILPDTRQDRGNGRKERRGRGD